MSTYATLCRTLALILILCLCLPLLTSCRLTAYSATYLDETFDTVLSLTVGARTADDANTHCRAIKALVSDLHRQFDAYKTYADMNNLAAVNAAEAGTPVEISNDLMALLKLGKEAYRQTDGAVHIGLGTVTGIWKEAIAAKILPDTERISSVLAALPSLDAMVLDEPNGTVTLLSPDMKLDVGAIAKGYVLDRVRAYAADAGIESLLCNLGGEILALGSAPNGKDWEISIADPDGGILQTIRVIDAVVATGGDYERGFTVGGKRYHHIIDPATGYPAEAYRAATVVLPMEDAALSDVYSTALVVMTAEDGQALCREIPHVAYLRIPCDGAIETNVEWQENMSQTAYK